MTLQRAPGRHLIYGLLDPRFGSLHYVGKTHKQRELRLAEHIETARLGGSAPVYGWIRAVLNVGLVPSIFVLRRVPGSESWQEAERTEIDRWRRCYHSSLPYLHPPQTKKSHPTWIRSVSLLNVRGGG